jgi:ribosomal protein L11 methyltransferase
MSYIEVAIQTDKIFAEIFMAELGEIGFESFVERPDGLDAYVTEALFNEQETKQIFENYANQTAVSYTIKLIPKENWNATWESNFQPISVGTDIYIRADFHPAVSGYKHEIIITPKMSFGTGHHETTFMVMSHQLSMDFTNKKVFDIGCGTGILAILAEKLGASYARGFDIEEWAALNSIENANLNNCSKTSFAQGTIDNESPETYDIVLANINRNILMRDVHKYIPYMHSGTELIVSGFYVSDQQAIIDHFAGQGLSFVNAKEKNNWSSLRFILN